MRIEVNQLRVDLVQLIRVVERLSTEIQQCRTDAQHAHETTLLKLENVLIKHVMQISGGGNEPIDS